MNIKSGDLFFTTSKSIVSDVIRFITHSKWSHVQIISRVDTNRRPYQTSGIEVITADSPMVILRDVHPDEWIKYAILSLKEPFTDEEVRNVFDFLFPTIFKGYDYWGLSDFLIDEDVQNKDKWFCSELAFAAYLKASRPLQERIKGAFVSPELLYISPLLQVEEEVSL
jgi:hypothetical protein